MGLFDHQIRAIRGFLDQKRGEGKVREIFQVRPIPWPTSNGGNLVLGQDTAVELGHPQDASASFLLWHNEPREVKNGRITLVGPDLPEIKSGRASFARIVLVAGNDFDEHNSFDRWREMELLRYDIKLSGYMMRGVSQYQREWSRVSRAAMDNGFSLQVLGGALMAEFAALPYIQAVEVVFITSGREDVHVVQAVAGAAGRIIGAMNKMAQELSFDCDGCEYTSVCNDVAELRAMRNTAHGRRRHG